MIRPFIKEATVTEISKSQSVRLADVFVIGPFMVYCAWRYKMRDIDRLFLSLIGFGTILYNGNNYLLNRKMLKEIGNA